MESIVETARLAGITSKLDPNLSLALGSSAVSPLDMACAYSTFARAGVKIEPQVLRKIENNRGQILEVFEAKVDKVFGVEPVARLVSILEDVVQKGTGTRARLKDRPAAGKTGTADEGRDIWFNGFTPDLVTVLWAGNDENKPIKGRAITGGTLLAPIWKNYMEAYYKARPHPAGSFIAPTPSVTDPADATTATENEQLAEVDAGAGEQTVETVHNQNEMDTQETGTNITPPPLDPLLYPVGSVTPSPKPETNNIKLKEQKAEFAPAPAPAPSQNSAPAPGGVILRPLPKPQPAPKVIKKKEAPEAAPESTPHNDTLLDF